MPCDENSPVAVLDRASILLEAFDEDERLTLSDLSRRTGLPASSTHRMLGQLVRLTWLQREGHTYRLGRKIFELGSLALHHDRLHSVAQPVLYQLHATTGLVVHLAVPVGADVLYLDKVGGSFAVRLPTRAGGRLPAASTAIGKTLMAELDPTAALTPPRSTPNTIVDPVRLRREYADIRNRGIAHDRNETVLGVSCVGAAVIKGRSPIGAISVTGPTGTFDPMAASVPVRLAVATIRNRLSGN